jgi:hypothetical protein
MFDQFHASKSMLAYFVTLIPKISTPMVLKDLRPISLLRSLHNLLSKVLSRRLGGVMKHIISPSQAAFLKGRNLLDGVLIVDEVIDYARKVKSQCLILKVDFEKIYDSIDWDFLVYMLTRLGFGTKWVSWMKACECGGSMSILVNGCPTEQIDIQ